MLYCGPFGPFLAILWRICALGAPFTGRNSAVVPQNWQVWGMYSSNYWVAFEVSVLCHLFIPSIAYSKMARAHIELDQYLSKVFIAYQIAWFFLVTAIFLRKRKCIFREKKWLDDKTPSNTNHNIIIIVITVTFTFSSILLPNQICLLLTSSDAKRKSNLLISRRLHIIPIIFIKYPISANYWGKHSFYHLQTMP